MGNFVTSIARAVSIRREITVTIDLIYLSRARKSTRLTFDPSEVKIDLYSCVHYFSLVASSSPKGIFQWNFPSSFLTDFMP